MFVCELPPPVEAFVIVVVVDTDIPVVELDVAAVVAVPFPDPPVDPPSFEPVTISEL